MQIKLQYFYLHAEADLLWQKHISGIVRHEYVWCIFFMWYRPNMYQCKPPASFNNQHVGVHHCKFQKILQSSAYWFIHGAWCYYTPIVWQRFWDPDPAMKVEDLHIFLVSKPNRSPVCCKAYYIMLPPILPTQKGGEDFLKSPVVGTYARGRQLVSFLLSPLTPFGSLTDGLVPNT